MCKRSQVRPFQDDDEAAHEHVTEHMRDLGERLLHEGDFSYEDTGQDGTSSDKTQGRQYRMAKAACNMTKHAKQLVKYC